MLTIVDDDRHVVLPEVADGDVTVPPAMLERAIGWVLKPEGLCRGDVCVPVRDPARLHRDGHVDLGAVAEALGRPAVVDEVRGVVALGEPAWSVAESMASLQAPDVTLPDLAGQLVSLSEFRRRKVLLLAWSSW